MEESITQKQLNLLVDHKLAINTALTTDKNDALAKMADALEDASDRILAANEQDLAKAQGKISDVMLDRLRLSKDRIKGMADSIRALISLPDPVGLVLDEHETPNGLDIVKKSVPFGVIGIIYESRPNVTSDAAALALKSGNAVMLRSGKDAFNSAEAIVEALKAGLAQSRISPDCIQLAQDTSHQSSQEMMTARGKLDLLLPRGGRGLIQAIVQNATVPVIETGTGICHIYVNKDADQEKALKIIDNAKTQRPSVCNAAEVCLVDAAIAGEFLPKLDRLFKGRVEMWADQAAKKYLPDAKAAGPDDFNTEFLDYVMAIGVVKDVKEAIAHINRHSTHHSEAIITEDPAAADLFTTMIDSATVYVNASTRFTDGGQFGMGCEFGISTQKMHARGPMGLKELTTYKYVIKGNGQTRD